MVIMKRLVLASSLLLSVCLGHAQQQKILADKILAQIGGNIILQSDIDNAIRDYKRNEDPSVGSQLPPDPECQFLKTMLTRKALVIQAERDSLPVSDEEINGKLDNQIRYFVSMAGGREEFERNAGKTIYQFREDNRPYMRDQMLSQNMQQKIVSSVKITPEEVEAYYNQIPKDSLRYYESQLEISEIVMHPKANKDVEDLLIEQLLGYKKEVESGKRKFVDLVKLYSKEPGASESGGMFTMNRLSKQVDPAFTSAAFRLKDGQISPPVKSAFGYHLIQMVTRVGDDATVRHLLLIPPISDADIKITVDSMETVRKYILDKKITFSGAVSVYNEDDQLKYTGGNYVNQEGSTSVTYDQIQDPTLLTSIKNMQPGDISTPQVFQDPNNNRGQNSSVRLIYLRSKSEPHRENLKDDYDKISARALQLKQEKVMNEWIQKHIPTFYVHLDKNASKGCPALTEWQKVSDELDNGQQTVVN
ncbi:MAG: peptidylprolyl isomerase [Pseudopedobacter saltans]|uniref:Peptidylprolyl isomerase n=1 Tax=Pseudopedobacter saltans TaxID=151895 RepID=A0A2W5FC73_9SPHI|nr:MAG: peptidylprolyl isomerase [Pseudopedobacter saltans]